MYRSFKHCAPLLQQILKAESISEGGNIWLQDIGAPDDLKIRPQPFPALYPDSQCGEQQGCAYKNLILVEELNSLKTAVRYYHSKTIQYVAN